MGLILPTVRGFWKKGAHKRLILIAIGALVLCSLIGLVLLYVLRAPEPESDQLPADARFRDASLSNEERARDLLSYMTTEEKAGQLALVEKGSVHDIEDIAKYGIGALLSGGGAKPENNTPEGWRDMVAGYDSVARRSRTGVPLLYGVDAVHGHGNVPGATIFPHQIGLGAANDPGLVEDVARATARELLATGIRWNFAPSLDLPRDIRWGRVYEAFSDDPARAASLGRAYVAGLQGSLPEAPGKISVLATPKHYLGAGSMRWGSTRSDIYLIDQGVTPENDELLRTQYLPPFKAAVDAGASSVMAGLNAYGKTNIAGHEVLLSRTLKGELGFSGFVVSDWYGVYELPGGHYRAAVTALNAGVDMVMLPYDFKTFIHNIARAVRRGELSMARLDDAVFRVLKAKFALGLFDDAQPTIPLDVLGSTQHRALARVAAARSVVVLKNNNSLLPLREDEHIRVAGNAADNVGMQVGAWTIEWQGVNGNVVPGATSLLAGLYEVAPGARIEYAADGVFASGTRAAVGIAFVGEVPYAEGWGDKPRPALTAEDLQVIARLRGTCDRLVVVLVTGRPLILENALSRWDALAVAWLPGSEGAGVADVLFGKQGTAATLPLPWPRSIGALPVSVSGFGADGSMPLFPRGAGIPVGPAVLPHAALVE